MKKNKGNSATKRFPFGTVILSIIFSLLILVSCFNFTFMVKFLVDKDVSMFGKSFIYANSDTIYPPIKNGSLCQYDVGNKNVEKDDIVVYFKNNMYHLQRIQKVVDEDTFELYDKDGFLVKIDRHNIVGVYDKTLNGLDVVIDAVSSTAGLVVLILIPFVMIGTTELIIFLTNRKKKKKSYQNNTVKDEKVPNNKSDQLHKVDLDKNKSEIKNEINKNEKSNIELSKKPNSTTPTQTKPVESTANKQVETAKPTMAKPEVKTENKITSDVENKAVSANKPDTNLICQMQNQFNLPMFKQQNLQIVLLAQNQQPLQIKFRRLLRLV